VTFCIDSRYQYKITIFSKSLSCYPFSSSLPRFNNSYIISSMAHPTLMTGLKVTTSLLVNLHRSIRQKHCVRYNTSDYCLTHKRSALKKLLDPSLRGLGPPNKPPMSWDLMLFFSGFDMSVWYIFSFLLLKVCCCRTFLSRFDRFNFSSQVLDIGFVRSVLHCTEGRFHIHLFEMTCYCANYYVSFWSTKYVLRS
jgi:hypothetical protein